MRKALAAMTVALLLSMSVPADAGAPLDAVQSAVASVIAIVDRPDLQGTANLVERRALLRSVTDDFFDFPEMAQRSLGYHRATPSERQRAEFVTLFRDLLERSYMTTIENYAGEPIVYLGETIEGDDATVRSKIVTRKRAEISVEYRLHRSTGRWVAVDVVLEHVSLVANYRQQFDRVIRTTSFTTLLARMRGGDVAAFTVPPGAGPGSHE
jgi:phospholipid transport system substrate-binding protein